MTLSRRQPRPGDQVTPQVRLVEMIGQGAMGSVWRAEHLALQTDVAVKFISTALTTGDSAALARFHREATTAAQIKSPHVVQTFDAGITDDGRPYIVMEHLSGETLTARLERSGFLSFRLTQLVVRHVASALGGAHRMRIVHRDIKPDNIFLTPSDEGLFCKVLDFGIAKELRRPNMRGLTVAGTLVGTPEFMSPEQMKHGTVDHRVDLWALAVVAYCALCTKLPFAGPTVGALSLNIMNGSFEPVSSCRDDLPSGIDAWFERAFRADPAERFGTAKEMARELCALCPFDDDTFDTADDTGNFPRARMSSETQMVIPTPTHVAASRSTIPVRRRTRWGAIGGFAIAGFVAVGLAALEMASASVTALQPIRSTVDASVLGVPTAPDRSTRPDALPSAPPPRAITSPTSTPQRPKRAVPSRTPTVPRRRVAPAPRPAFAVPDEPDF